MAQYAPDSLRTLPLVADVYLLPGAHTESAYLVALDQWRKLAPASELLARDLGDHRSYRFGSGDGAQAVGLALAVSIRLGGEARTARSGPYLRAGVTFRSHRGTDLELRKEERVPYDTLTSSQTGQIITVDSLTVDRYRLEHRYQQVGLDAAIVFLKEFPGRWTLHGGCGVQLGVSMAGRVRIDHTVERRVDPAVVSGQPGPWDDRQERETEVFSTQGDLCLALYAPLGVGYRLGRRSPFWRAMNLTYELRPALEFGGVPELSTGARASVGSYFGLRVDLAR